MANIILMKYKIYKELGQINSLSRMWYFILTCLLVMDRKYAWAIIDLILYDSWNLNLNFSSIT